MLPFIDVVRSLNPLAHWSLGEPVGATVISDLSGNGFGAGISGTVTFGQTGISGHTAARFTSSGYGFVGHQNALQLNGAHTIIGLCKPLTFPAGSYPGGLKKGDAATQHGYMVFLDPGGNAYLKRNNVSCPLYGACSLNTFSLLGFSYTGSAVLSYKNGAIGATTSVTFPPNTSTLPQLWLGRADFAGDQVWSDIAIFSRALSAAEHRYIAAAAGLATLPSLSGTVIVSGNGGADQVVIRDWSTRKLVATATPNPTTGAWSASVPEGDYDISYFAPDCQPVCHGPYTVTPA